MAKQVWRSDDGQVFDTEAEAAAYEAREAKRLRLRVLWEAHDRGGEYWVLDDWSAIKAIMEPDTVTIHSTEPAELLGYDRAQDRRAKRMAEDMHGGTDD